MHLSKDFKIGEVKVELVTSNLGTDENPYRIMDISFYPIGINSNEMWISIHTSGEVLASVSQDSNAGSSIYWHGWRQEAEKL